MMWRDSETELDYLDFDYLIETVSNIIKNDDLLPSTIGVYGDWGSGKSSLMYMCKDRLTKADEKIKCLVFNGWLFENYEDAKTAILGTILDEISKEERLSLYSHHRITIHKRIINHNRPQDDFFSCRRVTGVVNAC